MLIIIVGFTLFTGFWDVDFNNLSTLKIVYLIGMLLIVIFIIILFLNTYYLIDKQQLTIMVKPFYKKKIAINTITKIEKSNSLLSAPAPSFDRLEIYYGKFNSELVSPKNQKAFVSSLQKYNPNIINKI